MSTLNPFALLGGDENDDPADLIARARDVAPAKEVKKQPTPQTAPAKLPTKPPPPAQAVRDFRGEATRGRGGVRGGGRGNDGYRGRGSEGGFKRTLWEAGPQWGRGDFNDQSYRNGDEHRGGREGYSSIQNGDIIPSKDGGKARFEGGRDRGRGRGRGIYADREEQFGRRIFDRRSGSGRGHEIKRDGAGQGNWGVELDQNAEQVGSEVSVVAEKPVSDHVEKKAEEEAQGECSEKKEIEEEDKEMTLEEYEKLLSEKRKGLLSLKAEERKVSLDKDFESMELVEKKGDEDVLLKLGMEKGKKKEGLDKDERARKSVNINEFLKPAEGEASYGRQNRGARERGGSRGGFRGSYNSREAISAPRIEDPGQFPSLGAQ